MALPKIVQGALYHGMEITWYVDNEPFVLTGATLTGAIRNRKGISKAITGSLTPDPDQVNNPGLFTWAFSADDVSDIAPQEAQFYADFAGVKAKTFAEDLVIEDDISS